MKIEIGFYPAAILALAAYRAHKTHTRKAVVESLRKVQVQAMEKQIEDKDRLISRLNALLSK